jgi:site-specific DNA-cytosine methylase
VSGSHISLFAGVAMTDLAAEAFNFETVVTAEIDLWCRKVIKARYPDSWHFEDVKYVSGGERGLGRALPRPLLVSGGFPCQDVSSAGTGKGLDGARSGLWREFARVIHEFRPDAVLIENSPMLRSRGLDRILADLHDLGYDAQWDCIPAAAVGAPHMRDRIFIVAVPTKGDRDYRTVPDYMGYVVTAGCFDGASERIEKLPRSGRLVGGILAKTEPRATIKQAKQAILAHAVPCPATPTGAWPTPAASNPQDGESAASWLARRETLKAKGINGNGAGMPLSVAVRLFPTPTRADGSGGPGTTPKRTGGPNLRTVVAAEDGNGRLNPEWVEWMMGLPLGWTDPERANDDLVPHPGWHAEPVARTVPDRSVKDRSKRIRALGNGLVPQAAQVALGMLDELRAA